MKKVAHIVNGEAVISQVPDDWIECSVTGEYRPPEEFRKEGETHQTRTNCTRAYLMPVKEWEGYEKLRKDPEIVKKLYFMNLQIKEEALRNFMDTQAGTSVEDLIAMLMQIQKQNPNARFVIGDNLDPIDYDRVSGSKNLYTLE